MKKLGNLTEAALQEAARTVRQGGLIAFPTESFYGLGVSPLDADAVRRIYDLKGRDPRSAPILVLIRSHNDLESLVADIPPAAELLMQACWPGPLTLVFRAAKGIPSVLTAGTATIGIRLSAHPDVQRLLRAIGGSLTGTSANRSGCLPATTAAEVEQTFGVQVDLIVDGGETAGGLPSTVVDTTMTPPRVLREGRVPRSSLLALLGSLAA